MFGAGGLMSPQVTCGFVWPHLSENETFHYNYYYYYYCPSLEELEIIM